MLDRARRARVFVLYYLQSSRAAGLPFEGGMSHLGAQYYLYLRWAEQPLSRRGVDLSLSLPATVATSIETFTFSLQCLLVDLFIEICF